jgi:hypothetical protein
MDLEIQRLNEQPKGKFSTVLINNQVFFVNIITKFNLNYNNMFFVFTQFNIITKFVTIRLIVNRENGRRVKFGQGWTTFCHLNQIASGNVLNFKAACTTEYSHILIVRIV